MDPLATAPRPDRWRYVMDVRAYNRHAWDRLVERGDRWTVPVGPEVIAASAA